MQILYNDNDKNIVSWLRELSKRRCIPFGDVSGLSITNLPPRMLHHYMQCHFFAGIGGWPLALRLAGHEFLPCWTGSPPCQPFSVAGKGLGTKDDRHLAPAWLELIHECRPPIIFGEQVADAIRKGWLDDLFDALEREGYACGAAVLPACSVGAPHIRKRLFFGAVRMEHTKSHGNNGQIRNNERESVSKTMGTGVTDGLADTDSSRRQYEPDARSSNFQYKAATAGKCRDRPCSYRASTRGLADTDNARPQGWRSPISSGHDPNRLTASRSHADESAEAYQNNGFWSGADWLGCRDGKLRPVEPGAQPLAHGIPARVGRLRGYGNAIVPQVAAVFIADFMASVATLKE